MKNVSVLGSTGSIGKQTLEVAAANPDKIKIRALAAHTSDVLLEEQINIFQPDIAALSDEAAAERLKKRYTGKTKILAGEAGLLEVAAFSEVDTVLASMVGYAGLRPTLAAIEHGKDIALANKETLVAAGSIVMSAVAEHNVTLLPVDSEHSAIFQALAGGKHQEVKRLLITASGGPFRGKSKAELENVTLEQCLKHPNWSMGRKITVDSSTLANKGLEVIEAHWLFDIAYTVNHPESICLLPLCSLFRRESRSVTVADSFTQITQLFPHCLLCSCQHYIIPVHHNPGLLSFPKFICLGLLC